MPNDSLAAQRGALLGSLSHDQRLADEMARLNDSALAVTFANESCRHEDLTRELAAAQAKRENAARRRDAAKAELCRRWLDGALPPLAGMEKAP